MVYFQVKRCFFFSQEKSGVHEESRAGSEFFFGEHFDEAFGEDRAVGGVHSAGSFGVARSRRSKSPLWEALREPEIVALLDNLKVPKA
jgi:hypothetical protein